MDIAAKQIVRFGPFELDQAAGELRKDGARVRLQEQPLQVLEILLENPGNLVTREELQREALAHYYLMVIFVVGFV